MDPITLDMFRRNDPHQRYATFTLSRFDNESLRECVTVLEQNEVADKFWIRFDEIPANLDVTPLVALIQSRPIIIDKIGLSYYLDHEMAMGQTLLRRFLQAIAQRASSTIQHLELAHLRLPMQELGNIIEQRIGLESLKLNRCSIVASPEYGIQQLAMAFKGNTSLEVVRLMGLKSATFLVQMRNALETNTSVQKLEFDCDIDDDFDPSSLLEPTGQLITATSSLREVLFLNYFVGDEISYHIAANKNLEHVKFESCRFSESSPECFSRMFVANSHIKSLNIINCDAPDFPVLMSQALCPASSVKSFEIIESGLQEKLTQEQFEEILQLLENNLNLETLNIGIIDTPEMVNALAASIPKMNMQEFHFSLRRNVFYLKPVLMEAFRQNANFVNIVYDGLGEIFDEEDYAKLEEYSARNRFLQAWLADPGSVPLNVVPRAAARACGQSGDYTALFQSLRHNADDIIENEFHRHQKPDTQRIRTKRKRITDFEAHTHDDDNSV